MASDADGRDDPITRSRALEAFGDLLHSQNTAERDWQILFTENPFILMDSLPVRLSSLYPQLEIDSGQPDFAFFEHSGPSSAGYCGVIELKRPADKILRVYSSKHILPSAKLAQARTQVEHYLDDLSRSPALPNQFALTLANARYAFIVIGRRAELVAKCVTQAQQLQYRNLLPHGLQIVPYDSLYEQFKRSLPSIMLMDVLTPDPNAVDGVREPSRFQGIFDEFDIADHAIFKIVTQTGWIRMLSGKYRQIFGVPRKLWPIAKNRLGDYFYGEIRNMTGDEKFPDFVEQMKSGSWPWTAYDIEGDFNTEKARWTNGVTMTIKTGDNRMTQLQFDGWDFSLYQGDRIYFGDGTPFMYTAFPQVSNT